MDSKEFDERINRLQDEIAELAASIGAKIDDVPLTDIDRLKMTPKSELERKLKSYE